ncbi:hypothetical protein HDU67_010204 [Dinochytrium kinnereticum]|nr:hypothetical protein HDU67_010204 [Dinochytrium kinnereticum]
MLFPTTLIASLLLGASLPANAAIDPVIDAQDRGIWDSPAIRAAAAGSISERVKAANAYGRIQLPQVIDPLFALLKGDRDSAVVSAAAFALGQLTYDPSFNGGRVAEIVAALNETLYTRGQDPERGPRLAPAILISVGKLAGANTSAIVSPFLTSRNDETREQALFAIYRARATPGLPREPQSTIDSLLSLAQDPSVRVRRALGFAVARIRDKRLLPLVKQLYLDADEFVRFTTFSPIRTTGNLPEDASLIVAGLKDRSQHVRVNALNALKVLLPANISTTPAIRDVAAADKSFHVRSILASSLTANAPEDVWKAMLSDSSATVRASAVTAYGAAFGVTSGKILMDAYKNDQSPLVRAAAVTAATGLALADYDSIWRVAIEDANPSVVFAVFQAYAAAPYESTWILSAIQKHINATQLFLRSASIDALTVLSVIDPDPNFIYQTYETCLGGATPRTYKDVRQQIVDLLVTIPNKTEITTPLLIKTLSDPYAQVRNSALMELQKRGVPNLPTDLPMEDALELSPYREAATVSAGRVNPKVKFVTSKGEMVFELFEREAPIHVANFLGLVRDGVYNGLTWHRVVDNFVIQGGDPDGGGYGDAGFQVRAEINPRVYDRGAIGMPRSTAFGSGGCQIFISHNPVPSLDGQYTVFGKVIRGLDVIDLVEVGDGIISAMIL